MTKPNRLTALTVTLLILAILFMGTPKPARAFFVTSFESMVETMLNSISSNMTTMTTTVLALSDDIGTMADRILVMADNIGIMADRIVATEQLMADLVRDVTDSQGTSTLLLSPLEGELINLSSPLDIALSSGAIDYVLFMSNSSDMADATNILVQNGNTEPARQRAVSYVTGSKLYFAVKAVSNDTIGPVSNTVMVNVTQ